MIPIRVLGRGLIPRGYGIAPRMNPFMADLTLVSTIMSTPGLIVEYLNPDSGKSVKLTRENYQKIYKKHEEGLKNNAPPQKKVETPIVTPEVVKPVEPTPVVTIPEVPKEDIISEETKEDPVVEVPKEEEKEEEFVMNPIVKEEESSYIQSSWKNKHNKR